MHAHILKPEVTHVHTEHLHNPSFSQLLNFPLTHLLMTSVHFAWVNACIEFVFTVVAL